MSESLAPLVSVIIPVRNGIPLIRDVLDALASQSTDFPFEVIVIDSGSTDGTTSSLPANDDRFRLIEIPPSEFGHGRTRNLGIREARGRYCAFLTHDAVPTNDSWLRTIVKPLLDDEKVAGVFGCHIAHDDAGVFTKWEIDTQFTHLARWPIVEIVDPRQYARHQWLRQIYHFFSDNASCLRRSVWEEIPFQEVDFAEDQIWAKAVIEAGYKKAYAMDAVVRHSHNYSLMDRFRRSYDESRMFRIHFGYRLGPSLGEAISQVYKTSVRDIMLAIEKGWHKTDRREVLLRPFDNFARQCGYYVGSREIGLFDRFQHYLSRDKYKYHLPGI